MKRRRYGLIMVVGLLALPIGYLALRDVMVRAMIVTHTLRHEPVLYGTSSYRTYVEGDYEGTKCVVSVVELHRKKRKTYPLPCDSPLPQGSGDGSVDATVAPGFTGGEVITLNGVRIWHGEPSQELGFRKVLWYAVSYLVLLFGLGVILLRRRPDLEPGEVMLYAAMLAFFVGGCFGSVAIMVIMLFHGDPMAGLLFGVGLMAAWIAFLARRARLRTGAEGP